MTATHASDRSVPRIHGEVRQTMIARRCGLAAATILAILSLRDSPRAATWQPIAVQGGSPPARRDAAMVYDRARGRVVLFGGQDAGGQDLNDTWAFDLTSLEWTALATGAATRPPARFSMVFGIEPSTQRLLISTGQDANGFFNDVWSFDLASNAWGEVTPSSPSEPAIRYGSGGGIFDPASFTQHDAVLMLSHGFTFAGRFDDTWSFDPASAAWTDESPVGPRPLRRCLHGATAVGPDRLVIFGGCASGFGPCPLGDTWVFDTSAGTWTDLTGSGAPAARFFPAMTTMGDGDDALLFGGIAGSNRNDVWRLDSSSGAWFPLAASGTPPSPRQSASLVWIDGQDPALGGEACGHAILFGGASTAGARNDLWALRPTAAPVLPQISASKDGAGRARFEWPHQSSAGSYEVWRSDHPAFSPGPGGPVRLSGDPVIVGGAVTYTDLSSETPSPIFFYRARISRCEFM